VVANHNSRSRSRSSRSRSRSRRKEEQGQKRRAGAEKKSRGRKEETVIRGTLMVVGVYFNVGLNFFVFLCKLYRELGDL
jgi:hypothetical protein